MTSKPQVKLVDGRVVDNDSQEWREECSARHILTWTIEERREHLLELEKTLGRERVDKFKELMRKVFDAKRDAR